MFVKDVKEKKKNKTRDTFSYDLSRNLPARKCSGMYEVIKKKKGYMVNICNYKPSIGRFYINLAFGAFLVNHVILFAQRVNDLLQFMIFYDRQVQHRSDGNVGTTSRH